MTRCPNRDPITVGAIRELDAAIDTHARWLDRLHRALVCGTEIDPNVLDPEGHRNCTFGLWYQGRNQVEWARWDEDLELLAKRHQAMHESAHQLMAQRTAHCKVPAETFDEFSEYAAQFKSAARALQFRIINEVCLVDHLTGAWNRSSMFLRLAEEHERMIRQHQTCYLCMIDVDHFKRVNDTLGHAVGDDVLQAIVDIVKNGLRAYDSIFRYGGEEFLVCLPNTSAEDAVAAMDRIRADIAVKPIAVTGAEPIRVTASFGVAPLSDSHSLEGSIEVADRALFCAKAQGRDRVCRWDAP